MAGNSTNNDISSYLAVNDTDSGQTLTYTVSAGTNHSGSITTGTTVSTGAGSRTPTGWLYSPANGYVGTETFTIQVSDGTATATRSFSVTVNAVTPTLTSATYNASTNVLTVTGTNMVTGDTIDATKLTVTGEGGGTYTLAGSYTVTASSATSFSITLNDTDARNVEGLLNFDGTVSVTSTTYNLAGAANWDSSRTTSADLTGNGVTVSNTQNPSITSATYDATSGVLAVTGSDMVVKPGATNDITVSTLTLKGEGNATRTLTTSNVEITSSTGFSVTLNAADKAAVNQFLNKAGTSSTGGATYNLAAALGWNTNINDGNLQDLTNPVTVSNVPVPAITSATYDASTGALVVTGTDLLKLTGATNDIVANKFTLTGEAGTTYTLTDTANVEITSNTAFTLTLSATDKAAVNQFLNKNGTASTSGTTYNLAAAEDWTAGAAAGVTDADLAGNGVTVSNVAVPAITSATYDATTGTLVVTGTGFLSKSGAANDIVANKLTITGEGGGTYTLTDTANVDITSGTSFTLTLSATDKAAVNLLANKNGTASTSGTTFNIAAAEDWTAGAAAGVTDADLTGNGFTASNVAVPAISSAAYDFSSNVLTVTGTDFLAKTGATNDIDLTKLTFTGEGGATYTLTNTTGVEITSGTSFSVTLAGADLTNVEALLNKDGTASVSGATYNLAAAASWNRGDASNGSDATNAVTVSNYAAPTVTSATFDASSNVLTVTGTNLVSKSGASNDVTVALLSIAGEGGSYTLTSTDVDITNATTFAVTLNAADQLVVRGLLNKNGTSSSGATTYNLAAAEDWMAGTAAATVVADLTGNGITVSNVQTPTITSAVYDSDTGVLGVTGTNLFKKVGATNDIVINKLTFTGGTANATYTLTSASNVEITSATSFSVTLAGTDKTNVDALLDQIGTTSSGGSTYNLAAADGWLGANDSATNIADATNAVTVSISPKITSATYDAATGVLTVTGTNMQAKAGALNDISVSKLTVTGEGGATYTLTSADVELTSATSFSITLNATDKAAINRIFNKNGTVSTGTTTFNLAAADDWDAQVTAGDTSDTLSNSVTASNVPVPTVTSATYDASTGALVVTGTGFVALNGVANDIVANKFTFTAEGAAGAAYTLTDTTNVDITSGTSFTLTLSATDKAAVNQIINKNGTSSTSATAYNLAAAEDWAAGADAGVIVADLTGNGITASNVAVPAITSATYDVDTGALVVTGTGFSKLAGATNDIVANKFTFKGQGAATYTLTDTANVEITSGTTFTLTLSATDKEAVGSLLNKNGTAAVDATTYNLAAAEDWAAGADAAVVVADLAGNGITVSNAWVKSLAYSATSFSEASANDGSITATSTITLSHETFTGANGAALGTVTNVPAGLTASLVKASANTATLSFTGKATAHANANDVSNLTVTFADGDFTGGVAADVTGATTSNLAIDFADPVVVVSGGGGTNPFNPAGTSTQTTVTTTVGTSLGGGTVVTKGSSSIISNLSEVNQTTGVSDNGVVVVLAPPGKTIKLIDNAPNGVLFSLPINQNVPVQIQGKKVEIVVDNEVVKGADGKPLTAVLATRTVTDEQGKSQQVLELVSGQGQVKASEANQPLGALTLSQGGTLHTVTIVDNSGNGGGTTVPGTAGFFKDATDKSGSVSAERGSIVLRVILTPEGATAGNRLAAEATKLITLQTGEVARFNAKGELIGVYAGSLSGTLGKTGDAVATTAPAGLVGYPAKAVKLDGNTLDRLGDNLLPAFASVIGGTSNFAADSVSQLTQDARTGIVTAKSVIHPEAIYYGLPVGSVSIDPNIADGIVWHTDGTVTWTVKGVSVTFAPMAGALTELAGSAQQMGYSTQVQDNGALKLSGNGNYLIGLPRFEAWPRSQGRGFAWNSHEQRADYTDSTGYTQLFDPIPLDGSQLDGTVAGMSGWRIERDYFLYGGVRVQGPQGERFTLTPDYAVTLDNDGAATGSAYNGSDGRLYYRYKTSFLPYSQGFAVK